MPRVSEKEILEGQPWERSGFLAPPRGDDKWGSTPDQKWIYRAHGKARKRGFHPIHRSFPLDDAACLSLQRITIAFPEPKVTVSKSESMPEPDRRQIFVDQFSDVKPKVESLQCHWKGYTFFRVVEEGKAILPNDQGLGFGESSENNSSELASFASETCEFEILE